MFWRMELTRVSQMTELPHTRIQYYSFLSVATFYMMQLVSCSNRIGQFYQLLTNSLLSSGVSACRWLQSIGAFYCSARMTEAMPMDSLRIMMENLSVYQCYLEQMPNILFLKRVLYSWLEKITQEPTSQQVCQLIDFKMVGSKKIVIYSAFTSGRLLQLLIQSSSQNRSRNSLLRYELTSSFLMRGL